MIKRYYKNRLYIGVCDHQKDSWGNWVDVLTVRGCHGKPDITYRDHVEEYTPERWSYWREQVRAQANTLVREFTENENTITSYPIWIHGPLEAKV